MDSRLRNIALCQVKYTYFLILFLFTAENAPSGAEKFRLSYHCSEIFSLHRKGFLKNAAPLEESIIMVSSLDTKTYFKKLNFCGKDVFQKRSPYCAVKYYSKKCHFSDQNYNKK